jgi:hypothetical protein
MVNTPFNWLFKTNLKILALLNTKVNKPNNVELLIQAYPICIHKLLNALPF